MVLHYGGKYDGNEDSLPHKEHNPNAVPFKEADDVKKMSLITNIGCILVMCRHRLKREGGPLFRGK